MAFVTHSSSLPQSWLGTNGAPIDAQENIAQLNHMMQDLHGRMQQLLEDAVQMGVSENFVRIVLTDMIASMERPNKQFNN